MTRDRAYFRACGLLLFVWRIFPVGRSRLAGTKVPKKIGGIGFMPWIVSVGTAVPEHILPQKEAREFVRRLFRIPSMTSTDICRFLRIPGLKLDI